MPEPSDEPERLDYAGPSTPGFPAGWRGWLLSIAIMLAVAAALLILLFLFSRLVLVSERSA